MLSTQNLNLGIFDFGSRGGSIVGQGNIVAWLVVSAFTVSPAGHAVIAKADVESGLAIL